MNYNYKNKYKSHKANGQYVFNFAMVLVFSTELEIVC